MPWIPWFSRIDEDALEEAIQKTKSIRRASKRATVKKKQEGGKEKLKAADRDSAQDAQAREKRAQKTHALAQQVEEAYEKIRPRDTLQRKTQRRDVRAPWEIHARNMPLRQTSARGKYERGTQDAEQRNRIGLNRRGPGDSSRIPNSNNIADGQEDNADFNYQPPHILRSSRLPNRRYLPDTKSRDHHILNRRPSGEPSRTSSPYNDGEDFEEGEDEHGFGDQSQSGTRSSQGLDLSDDDVEGFEEQLLRLRRLDLLGSLYQPRPRDIALGEAGTERDPSFTRRHDERAAHVPGSFATDDDYEDEECFDVQAHVGPTFSQRPAPTYNDDREHEAHLSHLRRLETLRHSYSPPVDPNQEPLNARYAVHEEQRRGTQERRVYVHERDLPDTRGHHVSNRRRSLDSHNHGVDYDEDELPYRLRGETRPSRRHSHHVAPYSSQNERFHDIQRTHTSRRPAPDSHPAEAHPRTYSNSFQSEEPIRGRRHSDVLNTSYGQRISQNHRADNSRRSASKSQPMERKPRPPSRAPRQEEPPRRSHQNRLRFSFSQSLNQDQGSQDSNHPASTSRSTMLNPRPSPRAPRHDDHPRRRPRDASVSRHRQSFSQDQRQSDTRHPVPSRWEPPSAPTRAPSTQRTGTSRRSSSGPHLSRKTRLLRVIPRWDQSGG